MAEPPKTLPPNFFDKSAPETLPADFFDEKPVKDNYFQGLKETTVQPLSSLVKSLVSNVEANPLNPGAGIGRTVFDVASGLGKAHLEQAKKAYESASKEIASLRAGRIKEAALADLETFGRTLATLLPGFGPAAAQAGEAFATQPKRALGQATGLVGTVLLPGRARSEAPAGVGPENFPLTYAQRTGKLTPLEETLRSIPLVGTPLKRVAEVQEQVLRDFARGIPSERSAAHGLGTVYYEELKQTHPLMPQLLSERASLSSALATARRSSAPAAKADAFRIGENLKDMDVDIAKLLEKKAPESVKLFDKAKETWKKQASLQEVLDRLNDNFEGFAPSRQATGAKVEQGIKAKSLVEDLKELDSDNTLTTALGTGRAQQLRDVARIVSQSQKTGSWGYYLIRVGGVAGGIALGFYPGYIGDVALGALGARIIASALARKGGAVALKGFLNASEGPSAEGVKANLYAERMVRIAAQEQTKPAIVPASTKSLLSENEKLRLGVPSNLVPGPLENPLQDMLDSVLKETGTSIENIIKEQQLRQQMDKTLDSLRAKFRTQEAMRSLKK